MKSRLVVVFVCVFLAAALVVFGVALYKKVYPFGYKSEIEGSANSHNLDPALVASIIYVESKFDKDAVSSKGARGLMQLMPATAESFFDGEFEQDVLLVPKENIELGCKFLSYLFEKFGDEKTVLAMYNAGERVAKSWLGADGIVDESKITSTETSNYIVRVQKAKRHYARYFTN